MSERRRPRVYLFDNTLCGTRFALEQHLRRFDAIEPLAVFRIFSGLKLFQAGLELSSVGILSVFTRDGGAVSARDIADRIRRIRTLLGLGLSFFEVAALEVPWFLDPEQTEPTNGPSSTTTRSWLRPLPRRTGCSTACSIHRCCPMTLSARPTPPIACASTIPRRTSAWNSTSITKRSGAIFSSSWAAVSAFAATASRSCVRKPARSRFSASRSAAAPDGRAIRSSS